MTRRPHIIVYAGLISLSLSACPDFPSHLLFLDSDISTDGPIRIDGGLDADVRDNDIGGGWTSTCKGVSNIYFKVLDGSVRAVYESGKGRMVCDDFASPTLTCWWTEVDKDCDRTAPKCAGNSSINFSSAGPTKTGVERWSYGDTTDWQETCDMSYVGPSIPGKLDALFDNDAEFVDRP